MTKRECAVVMAFTGTTMLRSEDIKIFYDYLEELFGRPVYSHELGNELILAEIKEKSQKDFVEICRMAADPVTNGDRIRSMTADPVTNGDRIRSMTDEKLADFLTDHESVCCFCAYETCKDASCENGVLEWLKKEAN